MRNGNYFREYKESVVERYTTMTGIITLLLSTPIWAYVVIEYIDSINSYLIDMFHNIYPNHYFETYFAYLVLGLLLSGLGLVLNFTIALLIQKSKPYVKRIF